MTDAKDKIVPIVTDESIEILLDIPEPDALFHFQEYSHVLTNVVMNSRPQFTIGIFGAWGKGKTTLLTLVEKELSKKENIILVPFEAWRYSNEPDMLKAMLETLKSALSIKRGKLQVVKNKLSRALDKAIDATTINLGIVGFDGQKLIDNEESSKETTYLSWKKILGGAIKQFRENNSDARIVFLMDDLDRSLPEKAFSVLEAIKVLLDIEGFIFILALDKTIVENAVENHYGKDNIIKGADYIKKIIQVEFTLPTLRDTDLQDYVKSLLSKISKAKIELTRPIAEVIPIIAEDNPREVKRFINNVLIANAVMTQVGVKSSARAQVAFMGLKAMWPELALKIALDPGLLDVFEQFAQTGHFDDDINQEMQDLIKRQANLLHYIKLGSSRSLWQLSEKQFEEMVFYTKLIEPQEIRPYVPRIDNRLDALSRSRIARQIYKAAESMGLTDRDKVDEITRLVLQRIEERHKNNTPLPGWEELVPGKSASSEASSHEIEIQEILKEIVATEKSK